MNVKIALMVSCLGLTACAMPRENFNKLEVGWTKQQVITLMGQPDSTAAVKGQGDCAYYSLWKDFWNREPGNYSDRYYVCYGEDKKVTSYGRLGDSPNLSKKEL